MQYTIPTFTSLEAVNHSLLVYQKKKRKIENELETKRIAYEEFMETTQSLKGEYIYQTITVSNIKSILEKSGKSLEDQPRLQKKISTFKIGASKTQVQSLKYEEDIRLDLEFELDCLEKQEASINDVLAQLAARKKELEKEAGIAPEEPVAP
jgi:peptidoglycan hydrolase CwlO-like protein